jgi:hypothetical protein
LAWPPAPAWPQGAACALEIFTDQTEYLPGQEVKVFYELIVGDRDIESARFVLIVTPPFGGSFRIETEPIVHLSRGFVGRGFLLSLPALTDQSDRLVTQGLYRLRAVLQASANGEIYCEGRASFRIRSAFGQKFSHQALLIAPPRSQITESFVTTLAVWLAAGFQTSARSLFQQGLFLSYQKGDYRHYDLIIYHGLDFTQPPPAALLEDIFTGEDICKKKIVWLGYHLDRVPAELLAQTGLAFGEVEAVSDPASRPLVYLHSGTAYELPHPDRVSVKIQDETLAQPLATAADKILVARAKHQRCPQDGPYFYFVGFPPTAYLRPFGAHLVFLDVLNEALGIERGRTALVRLEDVHARVTAFDLLSLTALLKSEKVPFTLALIPIYVHGSQRLSLSEHTEFRTLIKRALLDGGQIVVHGATHQHQGQTAADYEFYDPKTGNFVGGADYARERVRLALQEIVQSGLAPHTVGWETPHYKASPEHYAVFEEHFGLLYESAQLFNLDLLPFPIETRRSTYVPTPLGYVAGESPDQEVQRILRQAQLLAGLRHGALASFFYHPGNLGVERLRTLIQGLKSQGWTFQPVSALASSTRISFPPEGGK